MDFVICSVLNRLFLRCDRCCTRRRRGSSTIEVWESVLWVSDVVHIVRTGLNQLLFLSELSHRSPQYAELNQETMDILRRLLYAPSLPTICGDLYNNPFPSLLQEDTLQLPCTPSARGRHSPVCSSPLEPLTVQRPGGRLLCDRDMVQQGCKGSRKVCEGEPCATQEESVYNHPLKRSVEAHTWSSVCVLLC